MRTTLSKDDAIYTLGTNSNSILTFILVVLLLAVDFYYLKNIAGRRLVGLRWWNEVDPASGDTKWVFESADPDSRPGGFNATDRRFFWLALYAQPAIWILLGVVAIIKLISFVNFTLLWLVLVGEQRCTRILATGGRLTFKNTVIALVLTITNTLAFSRCDKFGHATNLASSALASGGLARNVAGGLITRFWR